MQLTRSTPFPGVACIAGALLLLSQAVLAADISVVGLFRDKAVLVVDGAAPKTYSVGNVISGDLRLVGVSGSAATFDANGKRQTIELGSHFNRVAASSGLASTTLTADGRGHFMVQGQINGGTVRMLLDTGATMVALPATEALRLGIDYKKGQVGQVNTANGPALAYRVRLDTVKLGNIELNQVDATVLEQGLSVTLLGMSFLNRTEMRQEGSQLILTKRF